MHISIALLFLAVCRASAILEECSSYKPFVKDWICPTQQIKYNPFDINYALDHYNATFKRYEGDLYTDGTENCVKDDRRPDPIIAKVSGRYRRIQFEELCTMEKVPIHNVYRTFDINRVSRQHECIVVNTGWMRQEMYYAQCFNPTTRSHDECQLDYGSRSHFRCIQSGFVRKRVLLFCPDINDYVFSTHRVPTTCSCRKCFHCERENTFFTGLLSDLAMPF